jgi:glutamine amidotransferase
MCRVWAHLGDPLLIDEPLFGASNSLIAQSVSPSLMSLLNIGGFGLLAWDTESRTPEEPYTYRTPNVPVFDRNLKALAAKVHANAAVAHVRGVVYDPSERVGPQNLHPFRFPGARVALAQNGDLYGFSAMRYDLLEHLRPGLAERIEGTTDTEWVYALVLSQLDDPFGPADADELADAVTRALDILREVRDRRGIAVQSPVNLVVTDGSSMVATRFAFDYGWYPDDDSFFAGEREFDFTTLWTTQSADGRSVTVASEPLTGDHADWLEVPEYALLKFSPGEDGIAVEHRELVL